MPKHKVRPAKDSHEEMAYGIPSELDFSKLTRVIGRGIHAAEYQGEKPLKVAYVVVDENAISYSLADGRKVSAPLAWYPRLQHSTPSERNDWRLIMDGRAVAWRALDVAISAKALLEGTKAGEAPASFRKWLAGRVQVKHHRPRAVA
jgi:hypothetical protein